MFTYSFNAMDAMHSVASVTTPMMWRRMLSHCKNDTGHSADSTNTRPLVTPIHGEGRHTVRGAQRTSLHSCRMNHALVLLSRYSALILTKRSSSPYARMLSTPVIVSLRCVYSGEWAMVSTRWRGNSFR